MLDLQKLVKDCFRRLQGDRSRARLVVAVSGGLDSMVLLHLLQSSITRPASHILVAHFDHRLRGQASSADRDFVERAATTLGLSFRTSSPKEVYTPKDGSMEVWARRQRHAFLATVAQSINAQCIVTAHHADDLAELFFLRLFRGEASSLRGMTESDPHPFNPTLRVIRPLLKASKAALLDQARAHGIAFREDASNRDTKFRRNWVRHELFPLLEQQLGTSLTSTIQRVANILGAESDYMDKQADQWLKASEISPAVKFQDLDPALQRRVVLRQFRDCGRLPTFDSIEKLRSNPGRRIAQEGSLSAELSAEGQLTFLPKRPAPAFDASAYRLLLTEASSAEFAGATFAWGLGRHSPKQKITTGTPGKERFDAAKIGPEVVLRHWRPGDRFQPIGFSKPAKLQDLFVSAKIPGEIRRKLFVAARPDGTLFWVEGLRMSELFKLDLSTRRYLEWRWHRSEPLLATTLRA